MIPLLAAAVGLIAGIHTATWGMYKDAPHEGFSGRKYARSIVLAAVIAVVIAGAWGLDPRRAADVPDAHTTVDRRAWRSAQSSA